MRRLFLLRHAKAETGSIGSNDSERSLAPRGFRQAARMGEIFQENGFNPAIILCSPALRTRQTLEAMKKHLKSFSKARYPDVLYMASATGLMKVLEDEIDRKGDVLLVGHNPSIGSLAQTLAISRRTHDEEALKQLLRGYPTCALSVFETDEAALHTFLPQAWRLCSYFRPDGKDEE